MTRSEELIRLADTYGAHNYHPLDVVIERAEGVWVWDVEGKKYLDCLSSYSAVNQGHRHPKIIAAMVEQAGKVTLTSRAFHNDQLGPFLQELCQLTRQQMALPMNTGAEAVETAIKACRKWGYKVKGIPEGKAEILVCSNNFHGRTTTIVGFSSEPQYREGFGPFTPGFILVPYGDLEAFERALTPNTAGFLVEPIQGEGGVLVPPAGYLRATRDLCRKHNILWIADEIQTGFGRTGRMFCSEWEGIEDPDMLVLGKALGGGLYPVSAVVSSKAILGVFHPGDHGSTFGGNPLGCAIARAALRVLVDENLTGRAAELGEHFMQGLRAIGSKHVRDVRGRGLLIGVEIVPSSGPARPFCERLRDRGILCKETHEQVIRFAPPLVITKGEIDWILEQAREVLA
ncbi:MAG: ornithine--oxo-acid transaminase [Candidatus Eisenbacteria bacterium]